MSSGVPVTARANQGAATTSTKVSASSLRHTKELHSGWLPGPSRPTSSHFASTVTAAASSPATHSAGQTVATPGRSQSAPAPTSSRTASASRQTAACRATPTTTGTSRAASHAARATRSRVGGA